MINNGISVVFFFSFLRTEQVFKTTKKKKPKGPNEPSTKEKNGDDKEKEKKEKVDITTRKTQLFKIIRQPFRQILIQAITEKSINSTKICGLASLLFLKKVQTAFDEVHFEFFNQDGEKIIRQCFFEVLSKSARKNKTDREFLELVQNNHITWPNNDYYGNAMNELIKTYITNVKTNLMVHGKKRLRQFLKMKIFQLNSSNPLVIKYENKDIDRAISLCIFGYNSIRKNGIEDTNNRIRRNMLVDIVCQNSWWAIEDNNITKFTKIHWFKSIQLWLWIQRQIDDFNTSIELRNERQQQRHQQRQQKRQKRKQKQPQQKEDVNKPPKIRNLAVIPICSFTRTHYTIDTKTLRYLLCELKLVPKNEDGNQLSEKEFFKYKEWCWGQFFDMGEIQSLVRGKKEFRFRIQSNGQAVSLHYDVDKIESKPFDKDAVVKKYRNGGFPIELGIDPGDKTWNATVQRNTETEKEVKEICSLLI